MIFLIFNPINLDKQILLNFEMVSLPSGINKNSLTLMASFLAGLLNPEGLIPGRKAKHSKIR